jgi:hypothetical protein
MDTNQAPDGVVMHWRLLPWSPDETHNRKPLLRVAMQQQLPKGIRRRRIFRRQPIVRKYKPAEQAWRFLQKYSLIATRIGQGSHAADEVSQGGDVLNQGASVVHAPDD